MGRYTGIYREVTPFRRLEIIVAPVANVAEAGLANPHRLGEQGDLVGTDCVREMGRLYQAVVEVINNGADRLSITPFADHFSHLRCAFKPLRGKCRHVTSVVKKSGEGQLQVRIVEPAGRLIA